MINTRQIHTYTIYSKRLAGYLLYNGCQLLSIETNEENQEFNVFKFIKSGMLERLVKQYKNDTLKSN